MKIILIILGFMSLFLGIIGVFLPVMPTTPFILLAAACFARSSEKFHKMLLNNRYFGNIVRNYENGLGISRRIKIRALTLLWFSLIFSSAISGSLIVFLVLTAAGTGVSWYILSLPTFTD
ncbi:DUF454 domain-containing protein [Geovibrio thiophilus]|uniref:DUF454 domain-containing protein n=1 Tax=Geovibrio thiophilus TaxID=139438 RepID=A0A410K0H7_9BACT|nr:YbaN family protein [Geovibrio thiophilus]QAR33946.1 DUF454 domain-containing protein [Geovibrio thiophilus]